MAKLAFYLLPNWGYRQSTESIGRISCENCWFTSSAGSDGDISFEGFLVNHRLYKGRNRFMNRAQVDMQEQDSSKLATATRFSASMQLRQLLLKFLLDSAAFAVAGFLAFELRFDGDLATRPLRPIVFAICAWIAANSAAFSIAHLHRRAWRFVCTHDVARVIAAVSAGSIIGGVAISSILGIAAIPRSVHLLNWLLCCILAVGGRLAVSMIFMLRGSRISEGERTKTLIYGAGAAGIALLHELLQNQALMCDVAGLVDDDPKKSQVILMGKPILGTGESLKRVVQQHGVTQILIAIPSATGAEMACILRRVLDAKVAFKTVPGLGDLVQGAELGKQIRDVAVEDLLGRRPVQLDQERIKQRLQGRTVMVTGAAGSIGSELCRQIAKFHPLALVGFDEAETPLFQLGRELAKKFPELAFCPVIGNITRSDILHRVMGRYKPLVLYHAAAYKHVPMMERQVFAAVENNILGTWRVACAAAEHGVEDFVMISTDKAVRPTSMMGATKRMAELVIRALQRESSTKFITVRFGNVLASNGSVVPIFKEQIAAGGPITVTHPNMCRYFMTIPEAAQLVLQASTFGEGGEVFVLDMGEPVKILDLAKNLILLSGLQPGKDIQIEITGIRPGEKLFEELNMHDEQLIATPHPKIRSYVPAESQDTNDIGVVVQNLQQAIRRQDLSRLLVMIKEIVPDYNPGTQLLKDALLDRNDTASFSKIDILTGQRKLVLPAIIAEASRTNAVVRQPWSA